jgi:hypothetical protein
LPPDSNETASEKVGAVHRAYGGQYRFDPNIEALSNSEAKLVFLPNPNAGVLNAKLLLESFVLPKMTNYPAFIYDPGSVTSR